MEHSAMIYDDCKVCEGRGGIPCSTCSGIGHLTGTEHEPVAAPPQHHEAGTSAHHLGTAEAHPDCPDCSGTGAVPCTACHGHGMFGLPSFAGKVF